MPFAMISEPKRKTFVFEAFVSFVKIAINYSV